MAIFLLICSVFLTLLSHFSGVNRGFALAATASPKPSIKVGVPNVVQAGKKTTFICDMNFEPEDPHIKKVSWSRKLMLEVDSNTTLTPEPYVTLVTYTYHTGRDPNITYWTSDVTMTTEYGLQINQVSVQDEGVYCCQVMTADDASLTGCATINVTVYPSLAFQGTNCDATKKYCKSYGHLGKNLTCVARHYRPLVNLKLKWKVFSVGVPIFPSHTKYKKYTEDGYVFYEAYSTVEFTRTGSHRYMCTANGITKCEGGCSLSDIVIVSRQHHLALWWIVIPVVAVFVILFAIKWKRHSTRKSEAPVQQPNTVYHPVTMDVEIRKDESAKELLS